MSDQESWTCGGTGHLLPAERSKASFDVLAMTHALDGGDEKTKRRRWIWREGEAIDNEDIYFMSREEMVKDHTKRFIDVHKKYLGKFIPMGGDVTNMQAVTKHSGAFALHFGAFTPTLMQQCTDEQRGWWLEKAATMKIIGALAQTELGHGSNVRGLQTTAEYDKSTQEFVLNTPTLRSMKWWPGGLGRTATHCCLYAQLVIDGKEYGLHVFMLQLRDENHRPLPGIELGEIGPKIGNNATETGYMRLNNVRIPRSWMLAKYQYVTPEGQYVKRPRKGGGNSKMAYGTMVSIRAGLVMGAGAALAQGVTIAIRYSCVRQQGFVDPSKATNRLATEQVVLDYQMQQYRLLKWLATSYAFIFTGQYMRERYQKLLASMSGDDVSDLPEVHATSAGLKGMCTITAADGLEDCRKACGGHGVMLASGISQLMLDYVVVCTAEGDRIILELQTARFILKELTKVRQGGSPSGVCSYLMPYADPKFNVDDIAPCRATRVSHFCDLQFLLQLFVHRSMVLAGVVDKRLKEEQEKTDVQQTAWNNCAVDLLQLARCHCQLVILKSFITGIETIKDQKVHAALHDLCALHGLIHVQENQGDWLGHMSTSQASLVREAVRELLAKVRPNAVALVDAFEFHDNVLASTLGSYDGKVYERLYKHAASSPMNKKDPFDGYEYMRPLLDLDFLKEGATKVRATPQPKL
eukprot:TRINITY_DN51420_c0_g1_i1.p1 TRINITY_DN51420_c0_g1~~TRINITY_DN51420_c0_g1_i1.p1  ORF type:complete len:701 (-),score=71.89 TRINITY_DN51420_c0_g1_i1:243-2324(-)